MSDSIIAAQGTGPIASISSTLTPASGPMLNPSRAA
jgi:hypothetical protein